MSKHIHAEFIKAWADGAVIQYSDGERFIDCPNNNPEWNIKHEYRIKPNDNDIVKYGIEVGDVWLVNDTDIVCVSLIGQGFISTINKGSWSHKHINKLLFRRGLINNL